MKRNCYMRIIVVFSILSLMSIGVFLKPANALLSQNSFSWFWTSDTNVSGTATGDINNDGINEVVTVGYYNNGVNWVGQLVVWDSITLAPKGVQTWLWGTNTHVSAVAIGNLTGSTTSLDIVTVGEYFDGTSWIGQMVTWNGATLAVEGVRTWNWGTNTHVSSVAVGNLTGRTTMDIVTVGSYSSGAGSTAQMVTWNGATLAVENIRVWLWGTSTEVSSVAVGNLTGGSVMDIVTVGNYSSGAGSTAQMVTWNGTTLAVENIQVWLWGTSNDVSSVAIGNVTGGTTLDIVTCGSYRSGTSTIAQLVVWNGISLAAEKIQVWQWGTTTNAVSVALGNFTGGKTLDVITGGSYNDAVRSYGQVVYWNGATLAATSISSWFTIGNTSVGALSIGPSGALVGGLGTRIFQGGQYYDGFRSVAQLNIWA